MADGVGIETASSSPTPENRQDTSDTPISDLVANGSSTSTNSEEPFGNGSVYLHREGDLQNLETTDGLDVKFRLRVLTDLLLCGLCRGLFRNACTIKECLHTFCLPCLSFYIGRGGDVCPKCREPFPANTADAFLPDVKIQNLVDKLFPENTYEELSTPSSPFKSKNASNEYASSRENSAALSDSRCGTTDRNLTTSSTSSFPADADTAVATELPVEVKGIDATVEFYRHVLTSESFCLETEIGMCIELMPANAFVPRLIQPYIRTSVKLPILVLSRYVAGKLCMAAGDAHQLEILFNGQVLANNHSLEFVCRSRRVDPYMRTLVFNYQVIGNKYTPVLVLPP